MPPQADATTQGDMPQRESPKGTNRGIPQERSDEDMPQGEPTGISRAKEQVQRRCEWQNVTTLGAGEELKQEPPQVQSEDKPAQLFKDDS